MLFIKLNREEDIWNVIRVYRKEEQISLKKTLSTMCVIENIWLLLHNLFSIFYNDV